MAMPFIEDLQSVYEDVIIPITKSRELYCARVDDFFSPRPIMEEIWETIEKSRLVIADLTTKNPNVFYEVGIAHALGKAVILLTQSLDDVPFDLRHIRCIIYQNTCRGFEKLKSDLGKTLDAVLKITRDE